MHPQPFVSPFTFRAAELADAFDDAHQTVQPHLMSTHGPDPDHDGWNDAPACRRKLPAAALAPLPVPGQAVVVHDNTSRMTEATAFELLSIIPASIKIERTWWWHEGEPAPVPSVTVALVFRRPLRCLQFTAATLGEAVLLALVGFAAFNGEAIQ